MGNDPISVAMDGLPSEGRNSFGGKRTAGPKRLRWVSHETAKSRACRPDAAFVPFRSAKTRPQCACGEREQTLWQVRRALRVSQQPLGKLKAVEPKRCHSQIAA